MTDAIQNSVNIQTKQSDESSLPQTVLGIVGGAGAGLALRKSVVQLSKPYYKTLLENMDKFTPQEKETLMQEADRMVEESDLVKKGFNGINYIDSNKCNIDLKAYKAKIRKISNTSFKKSKNLLELIKNYTKALEPLVPKSSNGLSIQEALIKHEVDFCKSVLQGKNVLKIVFSILCFPLAKVSDLLTGKIKDSKLNTKKLVEGLKNGCFDPFSNKIFTSKPASVLHEIGHAINRNKNFLTKIPHNLILISKGALIPLAILTAVFTKKPQKSDTEQSKNKGSFEKLKEFVHKNVGLTLAGLSIPLLVEEGLASARAIKFVNASKVLSATAKNQHNKVLKMAYGSYLLQTAVLASVASLAVFVKDKIVEYTTKN